MKLLFWIDIALAAVVLALFAASNRQSVTLGLWPLAYILDLPLYLAILAALLIGFLSGVLAAWIAGRCRRREIRRCGRRIAALEHELAVSQARLPGPGESPPARLASRG